MGYTYLLTKQLLFLSVNEYLILTKSDLKVGVGGPGCCCCANGFGRPASDLLATSRSGLGGGKNVGGSGGAKLPIESVVPSGRVHSLDLL